MKRFEYRLEGLLRLRRQQLKQTDARVQKARAAVVTLEKQLEIHQKSLIDSAHQLTQVVESSRGGLSLDAVSAWTRELNSQIASTRAKRDQANTEHQRILTQRRTEAAAVKALEMHRESRLDAYRLNQERQRQIVIDEDVMRRWKPEQPV